MKLFEVTETDEQQTNTKPMKQVLLISLGYDYESMMYSAEMGVEATYMFIDGKFYKSWIYYEDHEGEVDNSTHREAIAMAKHFGVQMSVNEVDIEVNEDNQGELEKAGFLDEEGGFEYGTDLDIDLTNTKYLKVGGKKHYLVK